MNEIVLSSKELLSDVLEPYLNFSVDLINLVESHWSDHPSKRFESVAIGVFLAGIEKTLNIAFALLYIAGKVSWSWMVPNTREKPPTGFIICQRGLTAKIKKLNELGVDVTHFQWLIEMRNSFFHDSSMYIGYSVSLDETEDSINLTPNGPIISFPLFGTSAINQKLLEMYAEDFIAVLSTFIDESEWLLVWREILEKISHLPRNPEPQYSEFFEFPDQQDELICLLNKEHIGDGANKLLS